MELPWWLCKVFRILKTTQNTHIQHFICLLVLFLNVFMVWYRLHPSEDWWLNWAFNSFFFLFRSYQNDNSSYQNTNNCQYLITSCVSLNNKFGERKYLQKFWMVIDLQTKFEWVHLVWLKLFFSFFFLPPIDYINFIKLT